MNKQKKREKLTKEERLLKQLDDIRTSDILEGYLKKELMIHSLEGYKAQAKQEVLEEAIKEINNAWPEDYNPRRDEVLEQLKNKS